MRRVAGGLRKCKTLSVCRVKRSPLPRRWRCRWRYGFRRRFCSRRLPPPPPATSRRSIKCEGTRLTLTVFTFDAVVRFGRMLVDTVTEWFASTSDTPAYKPDVMREISSHLVTDRLARFTNVRICIKLLVVAILTRMTLLSCRPCGIWALTKSLRETNPRTVLAVTNALITHKANTVK